MGGRRDEQAYAQRRKQINHRKQEQHQQIADDGNTVPELGKRETQRQLKDADGRKRDDLADDQFVLF